MNKITRMEIDLGRNAHHVRALDRARAGHSTTRMPRSARRNADPNRPTEAPSALWALAERTCRDTMFQNPNSVAGIFEEFCRGNRGAVHASAATRILRSRRLPANVVTVVERPLHPRPPVWSGRCGTGHARRSVPPSTALSRKPGRAACDPLNPLLTCLGLFYGGKSVTRQARSSPSPLSSALPERSLTSRSVHNSPRRTRIGLRENAPLAFTLTTQNGE